MERKPLMRKNTYNIILKSIETEISKTHDGSGRSSGLRESFKKFEEKYKDSDEPHMEIYDYNGKKLGEMKESDFKEGREGFHDKVKSDGLTSVDVIRNTPAGTPPYVAYEEAIELLGRYKPGESKDEWRYRSVTVVSEEGSMTLMKNDKFCLDEEGRVNDDDFEIFRFNMRNFSDWNGRWEGSVKGYAYSKAGMKREPPNEDFKWGHWEGHAKEPNFSDFSEETLKQSFNEEGLTRKEWSEKVWKNDWAEPYGLKIIWTPNPDFKPWEQGWK